MPAPRLIHLTAQVSTRGPFDWCQSAIITNNSGVHKPKAGEYAASGHPYAQPSGSSHVTNQARRR
jgi:hypothetical protein